jgi:hypothetical protein
MLSQLSLRLRPKDLERKEVRPIDQVLEAEADAFLRDPANWRADFRADVLSTTLRCFYAAANLGWPIELIHVVQIVGEPD